MFIATLRDGAYDFVLLLHIVSVVVGFGGVLLNPVYGAQAQKRPGPGGLAVTEANFAVNTIAEKFIYAVPLFGIGLVFMSDSAWEFSQFWIWASIVLYVVGLGIAHSVLIPTGKRMIALMQAGPPDPAAMQEQAKKLQTFGPIAQALFVIIMILMIWKPGL